MQPAGEPVSRVVFDTVERSVGGLTFLPRPVFRMSAISSAGGDAADNLTITLDAGDYANTPEEI